MKHWISAAVAGTLLATSSPLHAYDLIPTASVSALYSDNVARLSSNPVSDTTVDAAAGLEFRSATRTLTADVAASDRYREYINNTFPSLQLPSVVGTANWNIAPGHFSWWFEDEYGQVATDPFATLDTTLFRNANFATTGPTIILPLGRTNSLEVGGSYSKANFERSEIDSDRISGLASLVHSFSEVRRVSLNYVREEVKFARDDLFPNYVVQHAVVALTSTVRSMSIAADAGVETIEGPQIPRSSKPTWSVTVYRMIGAVTTVGLDTGRRFSDAAEAFRFDELSGTLGATAANVPLNAAPYVEYSYAGFVSIDRRRETLRVTVSQYDREALGPADPSYHKLEATIQAGYRLNARDALGAAFRFERTKGEQVSVTGLAKEYLFGLQANHQLTRSVSAALTLERFSGRVAGAFNENRIGIYLAYAKRTATEALPFAPYRGRSVQLPPAAASTAPPPDSSQDNP